MVFTVGFALAAFAEYETAAAWLAGGLAAVGLIKIVTIVVSALAPDY
jgi:hypothetical protein